MLRCRIVLIALFLAGGASLGAWAQETLDVKLDVPNRGNVALHLERHDAFAPGSKVRVTTNDGPLTLPTSAVKVYRGSLPNEPTSIVVMAVSKSGMVGTINAGKERYDVRRGPLAQSPLQAVVNTVQPMPCSMSDDKISPQIMKVMSEKIVEQPQDAETLEIQLAVDADYQFFQHHSSNRDLTLAYIAQIIGITSAIYERDFNVRVVTSDVHVWETESDPYPEDQVIFQLLDTFVDYYESENSDVDRDVAVYMTMRGGQGGIARSIGGVCDAGASYCAADFIGDLANVPNTYSWDHILLAHELGHVCGAVHTQSCLWPGGPLDSCITSESGNCVTFDLTRPIFGTIMSYCHQTRNQGGGIIAEFHKRHKHVVRAYLERASCVGARTPSTNNVLRGRLMNANTNTPIAGALMHIRAYNGGSYKSPPPLGADTNSTTAADGSFKFVGLSDGAYTVGLPTGWAITPVSISGVNDGVNILITDDTVTQDISVVRGMPVSLKVNSGGDASDVTFVIASDKLSSVVESIPVPGAFIALGLEYTQSLPIGTYTLVPHAAGRAFTPPRVDFEVTEGTPVPQIVLTSASTAPDTTGVMIVVSIVNEGGKYTLANGDSINAISSEDGSDLHSVTSANGVAIFERVSVNDSYQLQYVVDTTAWVPASSPISTSNGADGYAIMFDKRTRRFPLVARPYQLEVRNEPYAPLTDATRIIGPEGISANAPHPQYLSFPIRMGPNYLSKVWIYPSGVVAFSNAAINSYGSVLTSYADAQFVISPFESSFNADSEAVAESGVWWKESGTSPNRTISIEWRKLTSLECGFEGDCHSTGTFNFQLHVAESTGIITMHYGEISPEGAQVLLNIGLRGADKMDARAFRSLLGPPDWTAPMLTQETDDWFSMYMDADHAPESGLQYRWSNPATDVKDDHTNLEEFTYTSIASSDELVLRGAKGATISLVDMMGRTLRTSKDIPATLSWDVSSYVPGRYTMILEDHGHNYSLPVMIVR